MPKANLTDAAVKRYKAPPGERVDYFDTVLGHGFALRVSGPTPRSPDGRKAWVLFYRHAGQQKRLTIEPGYPAQGLGDARDRAREALLVLAKGVDPAEQKREAKVKTRTTTQGRAADTFENVVDEFMRRHMLAKKRAPAYIAETRRNFDNHVLPRWRGRMLSAITRREVIELLDAIADAGKPVAANRVLAAVRKLFNWAIQRGIVDASPVAMVERPGAETKRERALTDEETRSVWAAAQTLRYPFGPFFRLALATGQRRAEVGRMRWADLDLEQCIWSLAADMTKPGRAHMVPLSALAMQILAECPRTGTHVFTARRDRPISGYSKAKRAIDEQIAVAGVALPPWTIHDLRRTVATGMGKLGVARFTLSRVLNHADGGVTAVYDRHQYFVEKRQALDAWGQFLEDLVKPLGANVESLLREA